MTSTVWRQVLICLTRAENDPNVPECGFCIPHRRRFYGKADDMSGIVTEPDTGLIFVELSHEWGHYTPPTPGFRDIQVYRVGGYTAA